MKLPATVEYANKAVLELSLRYNETAPTQLKVLSEAQDIPEKFLIQLLLRLKGADIVNSSRGVDGGYHLARPPAHISLADVVKAVDESVLSVPSKAGRGSMSDPGRVFLNIWGDITRDIAARLEEITFDKLVANVKGEQLTYQI